MHHAGEAGSFGEVAAVASERLCVVYDTATGEICHTHRVVTLEEGQEPSEEQIAQDAILMAQRQMDSAPAPGLSVLHVEPDALKPGRRYSVDQQTKVLVEQERGRVSDQADVSG